MPNTTWNPSDKTASITLSNGNLTAASTTIGNQGVRAVHGLRTGKAYWEYTATTWGTSYVGAGLSSTSLNGPPTASIYLNNVGGYTINGTVVASLGTRSNGDVICWAFDFGLQLVWMRIGAAGNWNNNASANPATGAGGFSYNALAGVAVVYPMLWLNSSGATFTANFGDSAFVGAAPAGFTAGPPAAVPALIAASTQTVIEHWAIPNPQAWLTQVALEHWVAGSPDTYTQITQLGVEMWSPGGSTTPRAVMTQIAAEMWARTTSAVIPPVTAQSRAIIMA